MPEITISKIGFCKYRFNGETPENWTVPEDVQEGRGVQFWFTYFWEGNTCKINNIKWKPIKFTIDDQNNKIVEWNALVDDNFKKPDKVTIIFNGVSLDFNQDTDRHTNIYFGGSTNTDIENRYYIYEYSATVNRCVAPQDVTLPLSYTSNNSYMVASFKYEYIDTINDVTYYVDIPNIKIPKTSKYENNVVFTKEGVTELVGQIKNKVNKTGDTMSGNLIVEKTSTPEIIARDSTTNGLAVSLLVGSSHQSHGIYSTGYVTDTDNPSSSYTASGKWMVYRNKDGNVILNGSANTLTTPREIYVDLSSTRDANSKITFDGSVDKKISVSGTLPVTRGGTGLTASLNKNAVLIGNGNDAATAFSAISTNSGAFYATGSNNAPQFGTLPIKQGGTGATEAAAALSNLGGQPKHQAYTDIPFRFESGSLIAKNNSVTGVTSGNTIIVSPTVGEWSKWREYGIRCTKQENGSITLTTEDGYVGDTYAHIIILD